MHAGNKYTTQNLELSLSQLLPIQTSVTVSVELTSATKPTGVTVQPVYLTLTVTPVVW